MNKIVSGALAVLTMSLFAGCAGVDTADVDTADNVVGSGSVPAVDVAVGSYTLDKAQLKKVMMANAPNVEGPVGKQMAEAMKKMLGDMDGSIELKADNTCTMSMTMMGQKQDVSGVWARNGDQLSITAQEEGKEDDTRFATLADGIIMITDNQGGKSMQMRFVRNAQ